MRKVTTVALLTAVLAALALGGRGAAQDDKKDDQTPLSIEDYLRKHERWLKNLENEKNDLQGRLKRAEEIIKAQGDELARIGKTAGDNSRRIEDHDERLDRVDERLAGLASINPPVGSVVAFADHWPPRRHNLGPGAKEFWSEDEIGWMLCNGSKFNSSTHPELGIVPKWCTEHSVRT